MKLTFHSLFPCLVLAISFQCDAGVLIDVKQTGSEIEISWLADLAERYVVQRSQDFSLWDDVESVIKTEDDGQPISIRVAADQQFAFFRIVSEPLLGSFSRPKVKA